MGVSKNRGIPKWMVKIMENPMNKWMIWGVFPLFLVQHPYSICIETRRWPWAWSVLNPPGSCLPVANWCGTSIGMVSSRDPNSKVGTVTSNVWG